MNWCVSLARAPITITFRQQWTSCCIGEISSPPTHPTNPRYPRVRFRLYLNSKALIASLTGMDISNASHYDGATAAAEACISAYHHFRGKRPKGCLVPAAQPAVPANYTKLILDYWKTRRSSHPKIFPPMLILAKLSSLIDNQTALSTCPIS